MKSKPFVCSICGEVHKCCRQRTCRDGKRPLDAIGMQSAQLQVGRFERRGGGYTPHQNEKCSESWSCAEGMLQVVEGKRDRRRETRANERRDEFQNGKNIPRQGRWRMNGKVGEASQRRFATGSGQVDRDSLQATRESIAHLNENVKCFSVNDRK